MEVSLPVGQADQVLLDVMDNIGVLDTSSTTKGVEFHSGQYSFLLAPNATDVLLSGISGLGTPGAAHVTLDGERLMRFQSGAVIATYGRHAQGKIMMPVGKDITITPPVARQQARHEIFALVRRSTPLVGTVKYGMVYLLTAAGPPGSFLGDNTDAGVEVISDPAINAGRWSFRVRPVNAGVVATLFDSGVAGTGEHLLGIRYDHDVVPKLSFLLDGGTIGTVSGLANVPKATLNTEFGRWAVIQRVPDVLSAGMIDYLHWNRYMVQKLAGWA